MSSPWGDICSMKLLVRDAARLLDVSEKTIYRWIEQRVVSEA
ncbi:MAG TPA: hypothetical protein PKO05_00475 [Thermoanaerobaculia bacterium]|nr:helix-turn-helix domain-containing protein [Thermoanaerobaculia bacterium]MBP7812818.1 helix-turn-helix domain-containing protein [Thermoanaerobaculia bacterium]MBP8845170.1 helix-turn-helix domain-containing protein [Thermoanaerobaculia bacterium]HNU81890.1 hypothetical protein [Thermoanaerobaculia bacterium]HNZ96981.1 hypothetical protein [Thermoanaerobaculia bacterium]